MIAIVASGLILVLKFVAYRLSGSAALQSDAIESIVNLAAASFALAAVIFAGRPPDRDHPYGHGKVEHFSAAFEGTLILLAALVIVYEGVHGLLVGQVLRDLDRGLALNVGAGLLNGLLGWYLLREGRRWRSHALEADGKHILSDFVTTLGIAFGLVAVRLTGWAWLDPTLALGMGLWLGYSGVRIVGAAGAALMDSEDPALIQRLVEAIEAERMPEIITVHEMRSLRVGRRTHVDLHVVVPEFFSVRQAHDIVDQFGGRVLAREKIEGEFHTHVDPCERAFCAHCEVGACPVRAQPFVNRPPLTSESATSPGPAHRR